MLTRRLTLPFRPLFFFSSLVDTGRYWQIPVDTSRCWQRLVKSGRDQYQPVSPSINQYQPVSTSIYQYLPVSTSTNQAVIAPRLSPLNIYFQNNVSDFGPPKARSYEISSVSQLVSWLVSPLQIWKTALTISQLFCMKLGHYKTSKLTKPNFQKKSGSLIIHENVSKMMVF